MTMESPQKVEINKPLPFTINLIQIGRMTTTRGNKADQLEEYRIRLLNAPADNVGTTYTCMVELENADTSDSVPLKELNPKRVNISLETCRYINGKKHILTIAYYADGRIRVSIKNDHPHFKDFGVPTQKTDEAGKGYRIETYADKLSPVATEFLDKLVEDALLQFLLIPQP